MAACDVSLPLRIGARTLLTLRRRLVRRGVTLDEALAGRPPALPPLEDAEGYLVTGLPVSAGGALAARHAELRPFVRQRYPRYHAALDISFDDYLARFSAKSRSTLLRKSRKLASRSGGMLDVRAYRTAEEAAEFHALARAVSAISYQERLLDAGLPDGPEALEEMRALAARDALRAWLLFLDGHAIAYLYGPAEGDTLVYSHLGYDPAFADLSPGSVLQLEAMRALMAEGRFRRFDFTEGEGQHKRQFATGHVESVDLLLVRPTPANLAVAYALGLFDGAAAAAKRMLNRVGGGALVRRLRR